MYKAVDIYLEKRGARHYVGRLSKSNRNFVFEYNEAYRYSNNPIPFGPDLPIDKEKRFSKKLFPSFEDRIPSKQNPAYKEYCQSVGISLSEKNPFVLLAKLGRKGQVYTQVIKNCSKKEILPLISSKIGKRTTVFTDGFKTYDSLVDLGYKKHYRVHHGKNEFAKKKGRVRNHINGIENFWGLAKVRLYKFRGMDKKTFYLHLKECEFRFNYRQDNLYLLLLKIIRSKPLKSP